MIKAAVLCFLILISISSCGIKNNISSVEPKNNPFFVYNFGGIDKYTPKEQLALLQRIGYDGISIQVTTPQHVEDLKEFIIISQKEKNFKIFSAFVRYNFQDAESDRNRWKEVVNIIEGKDIALWFIFGKEQPDTTADSVENVLRTV